MKNLKVALVHDYLREFGGAERVLAALHQIWPEAPVYTAFVDWQALGVHADRFKGWEIRETWITRLPFYKKLFSPYRIFAATAFADLDLSEFDVVISSSNAYMAKAVVPHKNDQGKPLHLCYCHTPPRALYGYSTKSDWKKNWLTRIGGEVINHFLRQQDFKIAQRVDAFIANSQETQQRIKKFYRRDSEIIYPPVTVESVSTETKQDFFLYVNRLALAKHPELAVRAALKMKLPLKVVGSGPMLEELKTLAAGQTQIEFLGAVDDQELAKLYAQAKALLYPVEDEDFGMVPVEAMLQGTPVIAHRSGGPQETIKEGVSGIFFDQLSVAGLTAAVEKFKKLVKAGKFKSATIKKQAAQFDQTHFTKALLQLITATTA